MHPVHIMPKPAGSTCNLNCAYCYYLEKQKLYAQSPKQEMSDETLERYIHDYIAIQPGDDVLFTWHGGEPLVRSRAFYEKALALQQKHAAGKHIDNALQTNGTLLTDDWCRFLAEHHFLVGISIDGTEEMHDRYRLSRSGRGTWRQVMHGVELLARHGVEWNAMAVVNDFNVRQPLEFYRFFKRIGCDFLQFTPIVERFYRHADGRLLASPIEGLTTAEMAPFSVEPEAWGEFLCALSCNCSMPRWPDGWAWREVCAPWPKLADTPPQWNTTATFMPATTMFSRNLSSAICTKSRWPKWFTAPNSANSERTNAKPSLRSAKRANGVLPATVTVRERASSPTQPAIPAILISAPDGNATSSMWRPTWIS